uniref:Uncharacterized protein n=1 Tax=Utricularia reniformis TaxID=192314 RepID=A0A1Y0B334_9LAMI|nr:hypothetical protein AEK19_MT1608 [Utricularia reniformis]ART31793.1 hypothetical protein AEK19_MT1608 [Utricularia reniformis]
MVKVKEGALKSCLSRLTMLERKIVESKNHQRARRPGSLHSLGLRP